MIGTVLLVILILLLVGALPGVSGHSYGYWPGGALGLVLIVVIILLLLGRI